MTPATTNDLLPYWTALAQIIPVLALAFVIESRLIVRRYSRKSAFKYRRARVGWSITFVLMSAGLTLSELAALGALFTTGDEPISALGWIYFWSSYIVVAAVLFVVLTLPVYSMVAASTHDFWRSVRLRLPWGTPASTRRQLRRLDARIDDQLVRNKDAERRALRLAARALLDPIPPKELEEMVRTSLGSRPPDSLRAEQKSWDRIDARLNDRDRPDYGYWVMREFYEDRKRTTKSILKTRKLAEKAASQVDEMTAEDSPSNTAYQKALRKLMADSARMN